MRIAVTITALALALGPAAQAGPDWTRLNGTDLTTALADRLLVYPDGTRQSFRAEGGTTFWSKDEEQSQGRWAARGDRYCSVWPPSDSWACYDVERSADRMALRFVDDSGGVSEGAYALD